MLTQRLADLSYNFRFAQRCSQRFIRHRQVLPKDFAGTTPRSFSVIALLTGRRNVASASLVSVICRSRYTTVRPRRSEGSEVLQATEYEPERVVRRCWLVRCSPPEGKAEKGSSWDAAGLKSLKGVCGCHTRGQCIRADTASAFQLRRRWAQIATARGPAAAMRGAIACHLWEAILQEGRDTAIAELVHRMSTASARGQGTQGVCMC